MELNLKHEKISELSEIDILIKKDEVKLLKKGIILEKDMDECLEYINPKLRISFKYDGKKEKK